MLLAPKPSSGLSATRIHHRSILVLMECLVHSLKAQVSINVDGILLFWPRDAVDFFSRWVVDFNPNEKTHMGVGVG